MRQSNSGFTLTEILVVIVLFGVGIGLFNTIFINNWNAYEDRIKRANLWTEANQFFEQMSIEGRNAKLISVTITANAKIADFTNAASDAITSFIITNTGELRRVKNAETKIFGTHADFAQSYFTENGKDLAVELRLEEIALTHTIHITAAIQVLARN